MGGFELFYRCRNCGRFAASTLVVDDGFCSAECALLYASCTTCGRYFEQTKNATRSICSSDCEIKYSVRLNERVARALKEEE